MLPCLAHKQKRREGSRAAWTGGHGRNRTAVQRIRAYASTSV